MKKAIIVGSSSGIGKALALELSGRGYVLGLVARREDKLRELQQQVPNESHVMVIDVNDVDSLAPKLRGLIDTLGGVDVVVISAGVSNVGGELDFAKEREVIKTNVMAFTALVDYCYRYFCEKGGGHIVAISSVSGVRGRPCMPAYSASKAFVSNYVEALRGRAGKQKTNVLFTDIRPGYVDTDMLGLMSDVKPFWVCSAETAAKGIARANVRRQKVAYITPRWGLVALVMKFIPDWINMHF